MKRFEPFTYIKKYRLLIILLSLLSGILFYLVSMRQQTYTVSAIIEYMNENAGLGKAPDGTEIDTSEIYSVQVMQQVFERMGMEYDSYNLDELRSRVKVEHLMTAEERAMQEAKNSLGEELEKKSGKYLVSFTAKYRDSIHPEAFARQVLDNMIDVYLSSYAENHINGTTVANNISGLDEGNYDYLEMAELMDDSVSKVLTGLTGRVQGNSGFRSSATGYSFNDLYREFQEISEIELPNLFAYILNHKVTKNKEVLTAKYQSRIDSQEIANSAAKAQIKSIDDIIASYVKLMRESGNTEISSDYILDNVHDGYYRDSEDTWLKPDVTVEYDDLLKTYVSNRTNMEYGIIDNEYCQYVIDLYEGRIESGLQIDVKSAGTDVPEGANDKQTVPEEVANADSPEGNGLRADIPSTDTPETGIPDAEVMGVHSLESGIPPAEAAIQADAMVKSLVGRLNQLYQILDDTNREYNEYSGAANVGLVSNIVVTEGIRLALYSCIAVAVFAVLLSMAAVIIGRLGDIFDYHAYTDHKFQIPNKLACDRYMARQGGVSLKENVTCLYLILDHVKDKNRQYGMEACDQMIRKFLELVKAGFEQEGDERFIAMNGLGQFVVFLKDTTETQTRGMMRRLRDETASYNEAADCTIEFRDGIAEAAKEQVYDMKTLLLQALARAKNLSENEQREGDARTWEEEDAVKQAAAAREEAEAGSEEAEDHTEVS